MSGINRYESFVAAAYGGPYAAMRPSDSGKWVGFTEHEAEVARLRAEVDGLAQSLTCAFEDDKKKAGQISELRAEVEKCRVDAERYRWLRNDAMTGTRHDPAVLKDGPTDCCEFMFGDELDTAIDAAMGEGK